MILSVRKGADRNRLTALPKPFQNQGCGIYVGLIIAGAFPSRRFYLHRHRCHRGKLAQFALANSFDRAAREISGLLGVSDHDRRPPLQFAAARNVVSFLTALSAPGWDGMQGLAVYLPFPNRPELRLKIELIGITPRTLVLLGHGKWAHATAGLEARFSGRR